MVKMEQMCYNRSKDAGQQEAESLSYILGLTEDEKLELLKLWNERGNKTCSGTKTVLTA